jgi:hypothetical protein
MAKLTKHRVYKEGASGQRYSAEMDVKVNTTGTFMIVLPPELVDIAIQLRKVKPSIEIEKDNGDSYCVCADNLRACEHFVGMCVDEILKCVVEEKLVILYKYKVCVSFAYPEDTPEDIRPSKLNLPDAITFGGGDYRGWDQYSVGLSAMVRLQKTYTSTSGVRVEYHRPDRPNFSDELYLDKLNNFNSLQPIWEGRYSKEPKYVPYTEEAAKFFYDMMIGLCRLGRNIDSFFGNPDAVALAIENRSEPRLLGS